jgi:TPR repeat protein
MGTPDLRPAAITCREHNVLNNEERGFEVTYLLNRWKAALLFVPACFMGILMGGCAGESGGLAAYKRGDYASAMREFKAEGSSSADFAIGLMHYKGQGAKRDLRQAATYFTKAAEEGHAGAQYNLGLMCANGQGVTKDFREAARWYGLAAEQGYDKAQYNLGIMYSRGDGVEKDRRRAVHWLVKSARQGNPRALKSLKSLLRDRV